MGIPIPFLRAGERQRGEGGAQENQAKSWQPSGFESEQSAKTQELLLATHYKQPSIVPMA